MDPIEKFGQFVIKNFRDRAIEQSNMLLEGRLKSPDLQEVQSRIAQLEDNQKELIRETLRDTIDTALHDILFAFQEAYDLDQGIEVLVDGENVAAVSGMLNGEIFGPENWIEKYSEFKDR